MSCLLLCWLCLVMNSVAALPPIITTQPASQTVPVGGDATFAVGVSGGSTLSYQWYFQASRIPGATSSSYTRTNAQLTHAGAYYVGVTNADGGVYSTNASLTVKTITTDNTSSTNQSSASSVTFRHTTGSGTNRLLLVGVSLFYGSGAQVNSITYGGQALALVGAKTDGSPQVRAEIWRLVNPPSGTTNVVVTLSAKSDGFAVGAMTFTGVEQSTPLGTFASASGNSPTPSVNAVSARRELVFAVVAFKDGNTLNVGANQTQRWSRADSAAKVRGAGSTEDGAASVTMSWSEPGGASKEWAIGAVSIKPALEPDVATTMTGPASVFATTNFTYTITLTNLGPSMASNLVVSDRLPAGINVVSVSGGGTVVGGGPGQVVFDRTSSNYSGNNSSGVLTWMHVTTNTANRLMLVGVSFGNGGATTPPSVSALTYGGVNLTKVMAATNNLIYSELWQLVNPPSGTNPVTLTFAGAPTTVVAGAATFSGVDLATPLSDVGSTVGRTQGGNQITSFTLNSAPNEIVFDTLTIDKKNNPIAAAGQTVLWNMGGAEVGAASIKPGTNAATLSWTTPKTVDWIHLAASVKAAGLIGVVNWTIPTLAYGATTNFTLTVTAPLGGTLSNNVSSTAEPLDFNLANNDGSATNAHVLTIVIPIADVVITQSGSTNVNPLTNYTYRVTVSNHGPCTASNVAVADTLDPMLTFVSASAGGTYLAGVVTWPALASLAPGATTNFTVTVRSPLSGTLTNTASSSAATTDPDLANNNGSAPAAQVATVVNSLQIANTSFGASVQTLNWSHAVAPGSSRILVVGVSIDNPATTVSAANFNNFLPLTFIGQANGTQSRVAMYYLLNPPVGTYPVSITLAAPAGIVGGAVSLNGVHQANPIAAFVGNIGTGTNASVTVASTLGGVVIDTVAPKSPRRATFPDPAQTIEWILSGANYAGAGSSSYGEATISPSWTLDSAAAWAMGAVALRPATVFADLTLTATGPTGVPATSNLTYTIAVTNLGSSTASNVVVSDVLPVGAVFVSASGGGTHNAGVVTWPAVRTLASGARTNYTVTITVPSFGTITNIVYATAFTADPDPSNNNGTGEGNQVVTTITPLADVATTVTGPGSVLAISDFTYTITVTNAGPSPASGVVVSDTLPFGATFVSASDGGSNNAGEVTWSIPSLATGAATNFTVTVTAPAGGTLTNSVLSTALTSDLNAANNNGSATDAQVITTVSPLADVATTVTGPASVLAAADFSYTITVTNAGPSPAANVVVSNTLPAGGRFVGASDGGSNNAGVVTWSIPSLATGAATNFTVTVTAPANGSLLNTVASTSTTVDLVAASNDGSAPAAQVLTTVTAVADIATTVTGPAIAITNASFSYTVTVANLGPSVATGVAVSDTLPAGVLFVTASAGGTHNGGAVTWSLASLESAAGTNFTVTVLAPAIGSLTNTVSSAAVTGDPDASNNDGTTVVARVVTGVYPLLLLTGQQIPGDGFQVEFYTHPDTLVSIQASTNLVDWGTLITTNSGDGHVIFIDQDVARYPQRFYRSRQGP